MLPVTSSGVGRRSSRFDEFFIAEPADWQKRKYCIAAMQIRHGILLRLNTRQRAQYCSMRAIALSGNAEENGFEPLVQLQLRTEGHSCAAFQRRNDIGGIAAAGNIGIKRPPSS